MRRVFRVDLLTKAIVSVVCGVRAVLPLTADSARLSQPLNVLSGANAERTSVTCWSAFPVVPVNMETQDRLILKHGSIIILRLIQVEAILGFHG